MVIDDGTNLSREDGIHNFTPCQKPSTSDVHFPFSTPRRTRAPSITSITDILDLDRQCGRKLTLRARGTACEERPRCHDDLLSPRTQRSHTGSRLSIEDLALEVQGKILDYIFGDMNSVHPSSSLPRSRNVASAMRHPRRKAVSDLALVSRQWRELVQERIYRHIKIKGTRAGLTESQEYFSSHHHLSKHVRHIEVWVPVWGDKASLPSRPSHDAAAGTAETAAARNGHNQLAQQTNESLMTANDLLGFNFKLSVYSATLSEIFFHVGCFFPQACIFTLEGGHCKKSNMIRHFPHTLFPEAYQTLEPLPNIRTFAMRGAWNIMRDYSHWTTIRTALPNVEEWQCCYAKPRIEAYRTINQIVINLPSRLRHVHISLDGMYAKDVTTELLSNSWSSSPPSGGTFHLCEELGRVAPRLESLSYTGKICSCFWTSARDALKSGPQRQQEPALRALEVVVKSCCRQRVTQTDPETGEQIVEELGGVMADGAGITNLVFISAFERLTQATVEALPSFPALKHVRIRFIDLDSPCALLNPYFQLHDGKLYGLWNEEILEVLEEQNRAAAIAAATAAAAAAAPGVVAAGRPGRPPHPHPPTGLHYEELSDGINLNWKRKRGAGRNGSGGDEARNNSGSHGGTTGTGADTNGGDDADGAADEATEHDANAEDDADGDGDSDVFGAVSPAGNVRERRPRGSIYPKAKPKSIKSSSYRLIAGARA